MARFKPDEREQGLFLEVDLGAQLRPGTLEYAIDTLIEDRIDPGWFAELYRNDRTGRPALDPRALLKVILFGYARGETSSRALEWACKKNLVFMALAGGQKPDHSTFAAFVGKLSGSKIERIFAEVLVACHEEELLGGTAFALDGVKLPANASKKWSGKVADLIAKKEKLVLRLEVKMAEHREADRNERRPKGKKKNRSSSDKDDDDNEPPELKRLRRQIENIERHCEEEGPKEGAKGKEVQGNVSDPDSAKMKTGHGVIQGYNAQALVDDAHQVIVAAEAIGHGQDYANVAPVMERAKKNAAAAGLGPDYFEGAELTADANYHSEANLATCEEEKLDAIIPDGNFRKRDPRFDTRERHKAKVRKLKDKLPSDAFSYDEARDQYTCPEGKTLKLYAARHNNGKGHIYRRYRAADGACEGCPLGSVCLTRGAKRKSLAIPVDERPKKLCEQMREKIDTPEARKRYSRRAGIVEPVFGNIRYCKGMDRFRYRGKKKVNTQWQLFCLVHNLEKLAKYGKKYGEKPGKGPLSSLFWFCQALLRSLSTLLGHPLHLPHCFAA
jgi:transposase